MTDRDLSLSMMSMGVARDCGAPARATFIIDWTGTVRYMMVHKSDIGRPVKEILRLVQAFMHSDLTGEALAASGWIPGGEVIPTDFCKKVKNFVNKFGHGIKMLLRQQRLKHRLKMKQLLQNRKKIKPNPKMRSLMLSLKKLLMKFKTLKIL